MKLTWTRYPVLGVTGWSGAGKTTLLEAIIPWLCARNLRVAVVKHDAHGVDVDRPGKDSDRLFRAGADVFVSAPEQRFGREREDGASGSIHQTVARLLVHHDVVLVEGHKLSPVPKLWLSSDGGAPPPDDVEDVRAVLPRDTTGLGMARAFIQDWLPAVWRAPPMLGGVLIGGRSRRMGTPKHLLKTAGRTWIEAITDALEPHVERVVLLGNHEVPVSLADAPQLADPPDARGPLAGVMAALRWSPLYNWIIAACDLPLLEPESVAWLKDHHRPGAWAVMPEILAGKPEPLLALYDFRCGPLLEELIRQGCWAPRLIADHPKVVRPLVPPELSGSWYNVNDPDARAAIE